MLSSHAVQLSSLKTETERIQAQKDQLQADLLASRTELDALRVALSHVQSTNKNLGNEKVTDISTSTCHLYRPQCLKRPSRKKNSLMKHIHLCFFVAVRRPCINSVWSCAAK